MVRDARVTPFKLDKPKGKEVLVFGSNLLGFHSSTMAKDAVLNWGAKIGKGEGMFGNSYAIPTRDGIMNHSISLEDITYYVDRFIRVAAAKPDYTFYVTEVGSGFSELHPSKIGPLFKKALSLDNVYLPSRFLFYI